MARRVKTYSRFLVERVSSHSTRLNDLCAYFEKSVDQHVSELPEFYSHIPKIYTEWLLDSSWDESDEAPDTWQGLELDRLEEFCEWLYQKSVSGEILEMGADRLPLFLTYKLEDYLHDATLVHFTNEASAESILKTGFLGVPNMEDLAFTGQNEDGMTSAGYCFAFDAFDAGYNFINGKYKYGQCGVVFKANAVKLYHDGDGELQCIFIGNEATGLKGFRMQGREFVSLDGKTRSEDPEELI